MTALLLPANPADAAPPPPGSCAVAERRLPPALAADRAARRRFVQTAQTLRRLRHPHLAMIVAVDEGGDRPAYRVEVIEGVSLVAAARAAGGFSVARATALLRPVCAVLDALHDEGLRCRELERDAVLEAGGRVRLREQGIALPQPGETASTEDDIRALGALAWTLLSGETVESLPSHCRWPSLPAAARAAIGMALAADPAARPPSASAFLALFDGSWPLAAAGSGSNTVRTSGPACAAAPAPRIVPAASGGAAEAAGSVPGAADASVPAPNGPLPAPAPCAAPPRTAAAPDAMTVRPRRRFEGWTTNAVAALLWVATIAAAGGAIAHYATSRGGGHAGAGRTRAAPTAKAGFPEIPGASHTAPPALPGQVCAETSVDAAC